MSELKVFDTEGAQLYPAGEGGHNQKYREWVNRVYFDLDMLADDEVALTMYARFRIQAEERPTFVRYVTEANADLPTDLRGQVNRALVQDANWTVVDSGGVDDPGFLFSNLVWTDDPRHPRPSTATNRTQLPEPTSPALQQILDDSDEGFVVGSRDFRFAATLVDHYWTDVGRLRVTDDPDMTPEGKLIIYCDETLEPAIELPSHVRALLEQTERRLTEQSRTVSYDQLDEAIHRFVDLDTPPQAVVDRLAAAIDENFDGIRVTGPEDPDYRAHYREATQRVEELEARTADLEASLQEAEAEPDSLLGRLFGSWATDPDARPSIYPPSGRLARETPANGLRLQHRF